MEDDIRALTLNRIIEETGIADILASVETSGHPIDEKSIAEDVLVRWLDGHQIKRIANDTGLPIDVVSDILKRMQKLIVREFWNLTP